MSSSCSRRDALRQLGSTGAGFALGGGLIRGQAAPIRVAGMPVEIAVAPVRAFTVWVTVAAVGTGGLQPPARRTVDVRIAGTPAGRPVTFEGKPVTIEL